MNSFANIVQQAQKDYDQRAEARRALERTAAVKAHASVKCGFNTMERGFKRQAVEAERADKTEKPNRTRRNTAACMSSIERQARILCILKYLADLHKARYSFPRQKTIIVYLSDWYELDISLRTLNRDLNSMEARGLFRRKRRLSWTRFTSTLYTITATGRKWWAALQNAFGLFKKKPSAKFGKQLCTLRVRGHKEGATPPESKAEGSGEAAVNSISPAHGTGHAQNMQAKYG